jgi:acetyl esterase/lipase
MLEYLIFRSMSSNRFDSSIRKASMMKKLAVLAAAIAMALAVLVNPVQAQLTTSPKQKVPSARQRPLDPIADGLQPSRVVVYKSIAKRELKLHIFNPDGFTASDKRPVMIVIHGGGWTGGDARRFYPFAATFQELGMVGISIEYRLLKKGTATTVFDCVKDGRSAVRYVRVHAEKLGIDPNRIAVCGGSAGGHVAASTAMFDSVNEEGESTAVSCIPNALVLYYPVIDTSKDGYGRAKIGERWKELSPVDQVKDGLPPTIVFHGTRDGTTPFKGAKLFHTKMLKAGNRCQLVAHEGGQHGYFIFDLDLYADVMKRSERFLRSTAVLPAE